MCIRDRWKRLAVISMLAAGAAFAQTGGSTSGGTTGTPGTGSSTTSGSGTSSSTTGGTGSSMGGAGSSDQSGTGYGGGGDAGTKSKKLSLIHISEPTRLLSISY